MKHLIHRTNGRIRIKCASLRRNPSLAYLLRGKLLEQPGVLKTLYSEHAGSLTVIYDSTSQNGDHLVDFIGEHTQLDSCSLSCIVQKQTENRPVATRTAGTAIASRAGQIAVGMLLEKGVRYSMKSVLGV